MQNRSRVNFFVLAFILAASVFPCAAYAQSASPSFVIAQVVPPPAPAYPAPTYTFPPSQSRTSLLDVYPVDSWVTRAQTMGQQIFIAFFLVELAFLGFGLLMSAKDTANVAASYTKKTIEAVVILFVIQNFHEVMKFVAGAACSTALQITTGTPQGQPGEVAGLCTNITPVGLLFAGLKMAGHIFTVQVSLPAGSGAAGFGLALLGSPVAFALQVIAYLVIVVCFALLAIELLGIIFESEIVGAIGLVFLGFLGFSKTSHLGQNVINYGLSVAVRMFMLYIIYGVGVGLMSGLDNALVPNQEVQFVTMVETCLGVFTFYLITRKMDAFARAITTGQSTLSGTDLVKTAAAAAVSAVALAASGGVAGSLAGKMALDALGNMASNFGSKAEAAGGPGVSSSDQPALPVSAPANVPQLADSNGPSAITGGSDGPEAPTPDRPRAPFALSGGRDDDSQKIGSSDSGSGVGDSSNRRGGDSSSSGRSGDRADSKTRSDSESPRRSSSNRDGAFTASSENAGSVSDESRVQDVASVSSGTSAIEGDYEGPTALNSAAADVEDAVFTSIVPPSGDAPYSTSSTSESPVQHLGMARPTRATRDSLQNVTPRAQGNHNSSSGSGNGGSSGNPGRQRPQRSAPLNTVDTSSSNSGSAFENSDSQAGSGARGSSPSSDSNASADRMIYAQPVAGSDKFDRIAAASTLLDDAVLGHTGGPKTDFERAKVRLARISMLKGFAHKAIKADVPDVSTALGVKFNF